MRASWQLLRPLIGCALGSALVACTSIIPLEGDGAPWPSDPVGIDGVVVADDGMSVTVEFIGGKEFDPDNPCSLAYEGAAEVVDDVLEVGVFAQRHPKPLGPNEACTAEGYVRTIVLPLDEPFHGDVIKDAAGQTLLLKAPGGLAEIEGLPPGWELRRESSVLGSPTPRWERIWSPDSDPWPAQGDSMVTLIQALGGPVDTTGGDLRPPVKVNGVLATYYFHPPTGEMVLVWPLGSGEVALVGNLEDFTEAEFIELAESVSIPGD